MYNAWQNMVRAAGQFSRKQRERAELENAPLEVKEKAEKKARAARLSRGLSNQAMLQAAKPQPDTKAAFFEKQEKDSTPPITVKATDNKSFVSGACEIEALLINDKRRKQAQEKADKQFAEQRAAAKSAAEQRAETDRQKKAMRGGK